jgi:hypothetical protein
MKSEMHMGFMGVLVEMINPVGIEQRSPSFDSVYGIAFIEEEFAKVGSILPRHACYQCDF